MNKFYLAIVVITTVCFMSCSVKRGCPTSGRSMGAEKLLSGDKETAKAVRRAGKFKS